jgi:hypothetical protein
VRFRRAARSYRAPVAPAVDLATGELGPASDLGEDASVGWVDRHPLTGARIAGRRLEGWKEARALALAAHRAFGDRLFVGWDIALTPDGALLIEGNGAPDLDIHQRCERRGMADSRFAALLAARLAATPSGAVPAKPETRRPSVI